MTTPNLSLIEFAPLAVFIQDFSTVQLELTQLKQAGVVDLDRYLDQHPDQLERLVGLPRILQLNPPALKLFGAQDPEQLIQRFRAFPCPERLPAFRRELQIVFEGKKQDRFRSEVLGFDGITRYVDVHWSVLPDHGVPYAQVAAFISDITEQEQREIALRQSESRLEKAQEIGQLGHWHWDIRTGALTWSNQIYRIFGLEPQAFKATYQAFLDRVHPEDRHLVSEGVSRAIKKLEEYKVDHRIILPHGEVRTVHEQGQVIFDAQGEAVEFDGTVQDVTEHKRFEGELIAARELAERANLAKSNFLATMSHELRTPMNGILGLTELLLSQEKDEEKRELLQMVSHSSTALLQVLNEVLDISRIEASKIKPQPQVFSPSEMVRRVTRLFSGAATIKGLKLHNHIQGGLSDSLLGDARLIEETLSNLMGNAIKFTAQGAVELNLSLVEDQGTAQKLRFEIADTGIGIDQDKQAEIFEPFTQADSSSTRDFGGAGLGLSIAQRLVRLMGGELSLESTPGKGSRFWFELELPVAPAALSPAQPQRPNPAARKNNANILLVEDEEINQLVTSKLLEKMGYRVQIASDGLQALARIENEDFDLVLMDCLMPQMDGYTATRAIRGLAKGRHLPIVALTARALSEDREYCLSVGMDDYLSKPARSDDLRQTIERHLNLAANRGY
ncbi:MAG: ATP-binding protein [bacterium]|nr:ATP-binding protein [bacterium]